MWETCFSPGRSENKFDYFCEVDLKRFIFSALLVFMLTGISSSCAPHRACPGNGSTGNYATSKKSHKRETHCPGTSGTGNIKPKVSNKVQEGLMSPKMKKQMEKKK